MSWLIRAVKMPSLVPIHVDLAEGSEMRGDSWVKRGVHLGQSVARYADVDDGDV